METFRNEERRHSTVPGVPSSEAAPPPKNKIHFAFRYLICGYLASNTIFAVTIQSWYSILVTAVEQHVDYKHDVKFLEPRTIPWHGIMPWFLHHENHNMRQSHKLSTTSFQTVAERIFGLTLNIASSIIRWKIHPLKKCIFLTSFCGIRTLVRSIPLEILDVMEKQLVGFDWGSMMQICSGNSAQLACQVEIHFAPVTRWFNGSILSQFVKFRIDKHETAPNST